MMSENNNLSPIFPNSLIEILNRIDEKLNDILGQSIASGKEIIDIEEASKLLNLSKYSLYSFTSKNLLPHYKFGRKIFFKREELISFILNKDKKIKSKNERQAEALEKIMNRFGSK